ncbi:c-type cytochrome [Paraburkholderia sp.]|uniref:c-type cytochrome n=1 Tax=Paraburkholderia sp. TaxID=1926495 RepID=UPI002387EAF5|nr:c-type cytochrome [Paraburkholderia sp.]MDE1182082.1 c-type cytochrome [Paraburkholderia sp.]
MTKKTSRVRSAAAGAPAPEPRADGTAGAKSGAATGARRAFLRIASLAAAFSLFALYMAWYEAHETQIRRSDEMPFAEAHADNGVQPGRTPASAPAVFASDLIRRGEYLARAGDCIACHTADKARPFAGGLPITTPFGTIYTPNITPDPETGIGQWTESDFLRAMHEGVGKAGEHLYPAFPYAEYTKVTSADVLAIRAYLNTLTPIHYTPPRNEI